MGPHDLRPRLTWGGMGTQMAMKMVFYMGGGPINTYFKWEQIPLQEEGFDS